MREQRKPGRDEDYPTEYQYHFEDIAPCVVRSFWVDQFGGAWFESADGQRVVIPKEARPLVSKRLKGAQFK